MNSETLSDLVGFDVSRETFSKLQRYHDLLLQWSKTHNLIGPKERDQVWSRHIADSLQMVPITHSFATILDIGSGAGFPGLVLACAAKEGQSLLLVEANAKRCAFLRHVSRELELPVEVLNARVEDVSRETIDLVTARAVADLSRLIELSTHWLESGGKAAFLKGRNWEEELTKAQSYWTFNHQIYPSQTDSESVILVLSEVRARNV